MITAIKLKGDVKLNKKINKTKLNRGIRNGLESVGILLHRRSFKLSPKAYGELSGGIKVAPITRNTLKITSRAPYTKYVLGGRRKGAKYPPYHEKSALYEWVKKIISPPKREIKSVSFLVARSIHRKGIKANPFFEDAVKDSFPNIKRQMNKHIRLALLKR